jgi:cell division protein FtsB
MLGKIKNIKMGHIFSTLKDVRVLGLLVFGVIALMVTWSTIQAIQQNYDLQKQISALKQQVAVQKLENENLKLGNQYYNTDSYLDIAARKQFGLGSPGEKLIVVPKSVALAHTVDVPQLKDKEQTPVSHAPVYQKNVKAWLDFFFNQQSQ